MSIFEANRDASVFPEPNKFDITRDLAELSKHLTFGFGPHLCVGNAIARLQMRTIIEATLLSRFPNMKLLHESDAKLDWYGMTPFTLKLWPRKQCITFDADDSLTTHHDIAIIILHVGSLRIPLWSISR